MKRQEWQGRIVKTMTGYRVEYKQKNPPIREYLFGNSYMWRAAHYCEHKSLDEAKAEMLRTIEQREQQTGVVFST